VFAALGVIVVGRLSLSLSLSVWCGVVWCGVMSNGASNGSSDKVDISATCKQILSTVAQLARLSSSIPEADDLDFFASCSPGFTQRRKQAQTSVLSCVESFLRLEKVSVVPRLTGQDEDDPAESFPDIVDITDFWLDSAVRSSSSSLSLLNSLSLS